MIWCHRCHFREGDAVSSVDAKLQFNEQAWKHAIEEQNGAPVFPLHPPTRPGEPTNPSIPNIIGLEDLKLSVSGYGVFLTICYT